MAIERIKPNEHVFIAGMTQSGKTFLAKEYLRYEQTQIYVLDTKGLFDWSDIEDVEIISHLEQIHRTKSKKVIYRPIWEQLTNDFYNAFFEYCMKRRNCIVVIDEVMQICKNSLSLPEWYKGILTRGMELKVSAWSLSQRPAKIPIEIMSESTHYFIFRLNNINDRQRLEDYTGQDEFLIIPERYNFWYFNTVRDKPPVMARLKI